MNSSNEDITSKPEWTKLEHPQNPGFQERKQLWRNLIECFSKTPVVALIGVGGAGKTSLASEWAHQKRINQEYDAIRWLNMEKHQNQQNCLMEWVSDLGIPYNETTVWKDIADRISNQTWLIVLDNVEDDDKTIWDNISILHASHKSSQHILITSRNDALSKNRDFECELISVDSYTLPEAVNYIFQQIQDNNHQEYDEEAARDLANRLDRHPLILEIAMGQIISYNIPLKNYLRRLHYQGLVMLTDNPGTSRQSLSRVNVYRTLNNLWQSIVGELTKEAKEILRFLSFVDGEGVKEQLPEYYMKHFMGNDSAFNLGYEKLRRQSLIKRKKDQEDQEDQEDILSLHRLLQEIVRQDLIQEFSKELEIRQKVLSWESFLNNVWTAIDYFSPERIETQTSVIDLYASVLHGHALWNYIENEVEVILEKENLSLHFLKAKILLRVGKCELILDRYADAEQTFSKAQEILSYVINDREEDNVIWRDPIANLYYEKGKLSYAQAKYDDAERFIQLSLENRKILHLEKEREISVYVARSEHELGRVYYARGKNKQAIEHFTQSIDINEVVPDTGIIQSDIVETLYERSRAYIEEKNYHLAELDVTKALKIIKKHYGEEAKRHDRANLLHQQGKIYFYKGNYSEAKKFQQESRQIRLHLYGQGRMVHHPRIAANLHWLGKVHEAENNIKDALRYYKKSLEMKRTIYRDIPNHPSIALTLQAIGYCFDKQSNNVAQEYYQQALDIYKNYQKEGVYKYRKNEEALSLAVSLEGEVETNNKRESREISKSEEKFLSGIRHVFSEERLPIFLNELSKKIWPTSVISRILEKQEMTFKDTIQQEDLKYGVELDVIHDKEENISPSRERIPIYCLTESFLKSFDTRWLFIHGNAGTGKTFIAYQIRQYLVQKIKEEQEQKQEKEQEQEQEQEQNLSSYIPILIEIRRLRFYGKGFVEQYLSSSPYNLNQEDFKILKEFYPILFILDGLDECSALNFLNFKENCTLEKWHVATKVLLTARTEWLQRNSFSVAKTYCIASLSDSQTKQYITKRLFSSDGDHSAISINRNLSGLIFVPIKGNGNCLYNAIGLHIGQDAQSVRNIVADNIERNRIEYEPIIHGLLRKGETFENYMEGIRVKEWGDDIELPVLMRLLNRAILVMHPDGRIDHRDAVEIYSNEPIFIFYNGYNHYDALVRNSALSRKQILERLTQFTDQYLSHISIKSLATSCLNLSILCEAFLSSYQLHDTSTNLAFSRVLDTLLSIWFQREIQRLYTLKLTQEPKSKLIEYFSDYIKKLAFYMFCKIATYIDYNDNLIVFSSDLRRLFNRHDSYVKLALRSCPLTLIPVSKDGKDYYRCQFIHTLLMEYAVASFLWQVLKEKSIVQVLLLWNFRFLSKEKGVLKFLEEFLFDSPYRDQVKKTLLEVMYISCGQRQYAKAASSAITVLNMMKFDFGCDKKLKNLYIPFANLTGASLSDENLSDSDLQGVNLYQSNVNKDKLSVDQKRVVVDLSEDDFYDISNEEKIRIETLPKYYSSNNSETIFSNTTSNELLIKNENGGSIMNVCVIT